MITRAINWLRGQPAKRPAVSVSADPDVPLEETVPVRVVCEQCLPPLCRSTAAGYLYWWLRELPGGRFVRVDLPRGDTPIDVELGTDILDSSNIHAIIRV